MAAESALHSAILLAEQENQVHKDALIQHASRAQAKLQLLDELIAAAEAVGDTDLLDDPDDRLVIEVQGAVEPVPCIPMHEVYDERSPFYLDALRRQLYLTLTTPRPFNAKEKEQLVIAVRNENKRLHALAAQTRGEDPFEAVRSQSDEFFDANVDGLDWKSVAANLSAATYPTAARGADECRVFWMGFLRPGINRSEWSESESATLRELLAANAEDPPDWEAIARQLGTNRLAVDCMRHHTFSRNGGPNRPSGQKSWTAEEEERLLEAVKKHGTNNWSLVALHVSPHVTSFQCQSHYTWSLDPNRKQGRWTDEEETTLRTAVASYPDGKISWTNIAKLLPGRSNGQCRERWLFLSRERQKRWDKAENAKLLQLVKKHGDDDWDEVSRQIGSGRTAAQCKTRYARLERLSSARKGGKSESDDDDGSETDVPSAPPGTSTAATETERRAVAEALLQMNASVDTGATSLGAASPGAHGDSVPATRRSSRRVPAPSVSKSLGSAEPRKPATRVPWSAEEDELLLQTVASTSNARTDWATVAEALNTSRTPGACMTRYNVMRSSGRVKTSSSTELTAPQEPDDELGKQDVDMAC